MTSPSTTSSPTASIGGIRTSPRWSLALLLSINLVNYIDRYVLASVVPKLKTELLSGRDVLGVPEPASWALMIVGFLGVGAALRRDPARLAC